MGAAEVLVALIAALIGFALVSVLADHWRSPANPPQPKPGDETAKHENEGQDGGKF